MYIGIYLIYGLMRQGETELLHELLVDEGAWLRMLSEGATSTFEAWYKDQKWNTSLFHLAGVVPSSRLRALVKAGLVFKDLGKSAEIKTDLGSKGSKSAFVVQFIDGARRLPPPHFAAKATLAKNPAQRFLAKS